LQTAVSAYARVLEQPGAAGLLYAELGAGSALAGLAYAFLPQRFTPNSRHITFAAVLLAITSALLDRRLPGRSVDVEHPRLVVQQFSTNESTAK
jgi:hypothetical protein